MNTENEILRIELPIGSEFVINNGKFICIENGRKTCMDCHLTDYEYDVCCDALQCTAERRLDGKDVCFKKVIS